MVIPTLWRLRQRDYDEFKVSQGFITKWRGHKEKRGKEKKRKKGRTLKTGVIQAGVFGLIFKLP